MMIEHVLAWAIGAGAMLACVVIGASRGDFEVVAIAAVGAVVLVANGWLEWRRYRRRDG